MIKFSEEKVLLLHKIMAQATGGSVGVRDEELLDSALESVYAGFGSQEFYPSKEEKAARLGYALIESSSPVMTLRLCAVGIRLLMTPILLILQGSRLILLQI